MYNFKQYWDFVLCEGGAAGHMAHPFDLPRMRSRTNTRCFHHMALTIERGGVLCEVTKSLE